MAEETYKIVHKSLIEKSEAIVGEFEYLLEIFKGKKILDIGIAEHHIAHYNNKQDWKHGRIKHVSSECLGMDIIQSMVDRLNSDGFDCICVDATSDFDIGRRFDYVHIGDVIEHVNNPVSLLKFASRHLNVGGKIIVTTPNPYFIKFILKVIKEGLLVANFEHVSWVTESMALEIAFRAGVSLERIWNPVSSRYPD